MTRASRAAIPMFSCALLAALAVPGRTQNSRDSLRATVDSLAGRLQDAEQAIHRLQNQIREQAQSGVQTRSRNRLELSGLVLMNGFYNSAKTNNADVPFFVAIPQDSTGLSNASLGAAVRQSRIGLTVSGMRALGGNLSADLQLDFYGGQQPSTGGRTFPVPRIRTAFARLDWPHAGLLVGQETQVVSPWNPVSFAAVGIPEFTGAGNLWFWVPQVRVSVISGGNPRVGAQAAALEPMLGSPQAAFLTQSDSAEKSQRPMVQGRVFLAWGFGDTESTIGVGVHRGWVATTGDSLLTSEAWTADARIFIGAKVMVQAEGFYNGQALAGLGGGAIGQEFGVGGVPVRTRGGWAQVNVRPTEMWEVGGGVGVDDPDEADLPATGRGRNVVFEGHVHFRPGGGLLIGAAYRRIETTYAAGTLAENHVNAFAGVAF
jgi:hypothetical protein